MTPGRRLTPEAPQQPAFAGPRTGTVDRRRKEVRRHSRGQDDGLICIVRLNKKYYAILVTTPPVHGTATSATSSALLRIDQLSSTGVTKAKATSPQCWHRWPFDAALHCASSVKRFGNQRTRPLPKSLRTNCSGTTMDTVISTPGRPAGLSETSSPSMLSKSWGL